MRNRVTFAEQWGPADVQLAFPLPVLVQKKTKKKCCKKFKDGKRCKRCPGRKK